MKALSYVVMCAALVFLGFTIGKVTTTMDDKPQTVQASAVPDQPTNSLSYENHTLKPYTGMGSGVLRHGTILKEDYAGPSSIIGVLNIPGIWVLEDVK